MGNDKNISLDELLSSAAGDLQLDDSTDQFEDIGQDSHDLGIDLDVQFDTGGLADIRDQPGFNYPSMLIYGIKFRDTMRVLQALHRESYRLWDVWAEVEGEAMPIKIGQLPADSKTFLTLRYLGLNVTLYLTEDVVDTLNLKDPAAIEKYI